MARLEPEWLSLDIALAVHDRQLAEHGGPTGVRDQSMLESALARPLNQWTYGEDDLCALAAAYAYGIARNHPFTDGNKRTAWVFARLFLMLTGKLTKSWRLDCSQEMCRPKETSSAP